jgi:hypothetical protein
MCLFCSKPATKKLEERFERHNDTITCYKVYGCELGTWEGRKRKRVLRSFFHNNKKGGWIKKPGMVISDRRYKKMNEEERTAGIINKGIHVYLSKKPADALCARYKNHVVVPVKCRKEDLVKASLSIPKYRSAQAVFMKVEITQKNWDRLVEKKRIR